ncbi:MAG: hypothetical protein GQ574_17440 [Crocinitomix sp.]|nr:hypothetical protein [Crocinitomix sp.]
MKIILFFLFSLSCSLFAQDVQCGDVVSSFEGAFANSSSRTPIVNQTNGVLPQVGALGEVSVYFETQFLGALMTGNLVVATAEVTAVSGTKVTFKVLEEHSSIEINGKKKNHFVKGKEVLFKQYEYDTPTLTVLNNNQGIINSSGQMVCGEKLGVWQYFDSNGNLSETYEMNDKGEVDGPYKRFYTNGEVSFECTYDDGDKEGPYKGWYSTGELKSKGQYDYSGQKDGICEEYFKDGKTHSHYDGDTRKYQEWFSNGQLAMEGEYDYQGEKDGVWKIYYQNGNPASAIEYDGGENEGDYKTWFEDGTLQEQKEYNWDGQKTGKWITYYSNGKPMEEVEYDRDKADGIYNKYFEDGKPNIEAKFVDGEPTGIYKEFYPNGNLKMKGKYDSNGKGDTWEFYFEEGSLQYKQVYFEDEPAGAFIIYSSPGIMKEKGTKRGTLFIKAYEVYYDSGAIQAKGNFTNDGVKEGEWITYFEDGKVESKGNYTNGKKTGKWLEHNAAGKKSKKKY